MTPVVLALGCLLQGPWNSLPVIDCNEGPLLYGAELSLKDGRRFQGYIALSAPLPQGAKAPKLDLFKPDCGVTFFRDPDLAVAKKGPADDCLEDAYASRHFDRAWLPQEKILNTAPQKIKRLVLAHGAWDGISAERFLILSKAERALLAQNGPRVPLTNYQGSGRMELAGGRSVSEDKLWALADHVAQAVKKGGRSALVRQKQQLLKKKIVLLFYPDVEP